MTFILFNYVTKSAVFTRPWMICYYLQRRKKTTPLLKQHMTKSINQSIGFSSTKCNLLGRRTKLLPCCSKSALAYIFTAIFYATQLHSWVKSGKYRNEWMHEIFFLLLFMHLCASLMTGRSPLVTTVPPSKRTGEFSCSSCKWIIAVLTFVFISEFFWVNFRMNGPRPKPKASFCVESFFRWTAVRF